MTNKEAIEALNEIFDDSEYSRGVAWYGTAMDMAIKALEQPERKKGKWQDNHRQKFDGTFYWFRECSVCGYERNDDDSGKDTNFCPNCGADMRGEQE